MASTIKRAINLFLGKWEEPEADFIHVDAIPGLISVLDTALNQSVEPQITSTLHAGHAWLQAWLDCKQQAAIVLKQLRESSRPYPNTPLEALARLALDAACEAVERLSTDRLASSANLSEPFPHLHGNSNAAKVTGETKAFDAGNRRTPLLQRGKDCWESHRLFCVDHVWAEDNYVNGLRLLRILYKQTATLDSQDGTAYFDKQQKHKYQSVPPEIEREASILIELLRKTLPLRLHQFRSSIEADSVVIKRLYIIKCEYRAPFRGFLEAHENVQRVPRLEAIERATTKRSSNQNRKGGGKTQNRETIPSEPHLKTLLETPAFVDVVALEQELDNCETEISNILLPFCNLARFLDSKKAQVRTMVRERVELQDLLQRLKNLLCSQGSQRSHSLESKSSGIRPLLLDLQGLPRDDEPRDPRDEASATLSERTSPAVLDHNISILVRHLQLLSNLAAKRKAFVVFSASQRSTRDVEVSTNIVRGCEAFDGELLETRLRDWFAMVRKQHSILDEHDMEALGREMLAAEIEAGLIHLPSQRSQQAMKVRERIEALHEDVDKRFVVLKDVVETVCLREMNLDVVMKAPSKYQALALKESTSALGIFGEALQLAGETLPIG